MLSNIPLAPLTTLGLGGPARWFAECRSEADVREALAFASSRRLPAFVLGGGSNVVVSDDGFPGVVLGMAIGGVEWGPEVSGRVAVRAGAGVAWDELVAEAVARGLQGVECLSGIPGTVGGTPIQNVGAYGQEIADSLAEVEAIDRVSSERVAFPAAECRFGYRRSRFKGEDTGRFVIVAVTLRLRPLEPPTVRYTEIGEAVAAAGGLGGLPPTDALLRVRTAVLGVRRRKSMLVDPSDPDSRSVGSFFTNPVLSAGEFAELTRRWSASGGGAVPGHPEGAGVKVPAAWLVEHAGFPKGTKRGGAAVSAKHALALVNAGGTAADLLALAAEIERAVRERFGIRLEREPVVLGGEGSS